MERRAASFIGVGTAEMMAEMSESGRIIAGGMESPSGMGKWDGTCVLHDSPGSNALVCCKGAR